MRYSSRRVTVRLTWGRVAALLLGLVLAVPARAGCLDTVSTTGDPDAASRFFHEASLLDSGAVMISGGMRLQIFPRSLISLETISFFDPSTGTTVTSFAPENGSGATVPLLLTARSSHTQTTLGDGRVLITGGHIGASGTNPGSATSSVELFNPETGVVASGPAMSIARASHSATRLPDGRAVIAGGASWQVFDPATTNWSQGGALVQSRVAHAAVLLADGDILLVGGRGASGATLERLDVGAGMSTLSAAIFDVGVDDVAAVALGDGRVLIVGGQSASGDTISDTYLYDPVFDALTAVAAPPGFPAGLADHVLTRVGRFVVTTGGESQAGGADTELAGLAIFDRFAEAWVHGGMLTQAHDDHVALPTGTDRIVVIDGGVGALGQEIPSNVIESVVLQLSGAMDLDGSGDVGFGDLLIVISAWGPCSPVCDEDLDGNGSVGFSDLLMTISALGAMPLSPRAAAVDRRSAVCAGTSHSDVRESRTDHPTAPVLDPILRSESEGVMDKPQSAIDRVRPILQAMERSVDAARRRRLHEDEPVTPPVGGHRPVNSPVAGPVDPAPARVLMMTPRAEGAAEADDAARRTAGMEQPGPRSYADSEYHRSRDVNAVWNPFASRQPKEEPPAKEPVVPATGSPIADIQIMDGVAVATLTVTELTRDTGAEDLASLLDLMAETGAPHFVLDVQNVGFMDTTCVGCLVAALNRMAASGGQIALANPNHNVHYVFRLTRLDRVFRISNDVVTAIDTIKGWRRAG